MNSIVDQITIGMYLIGIVTSDGIGIMVDKQSSQLLASDTLQDALRKVEYKGTASDTIHWMNYHPCVVKIPGKTEAEYTKFLEDAFYKDENGKYKVTSMRCIAGAMSMMVLKPDFNIESITVAKFSPSGGVM